MEHSDTVISRLRDIENGDPDAVSELWHRSFAKLVRPADKRLGHSPRRHFDEEDVALSVFNSLHRCATNGRLVEVANKEELWRLLVSFKAQKVIDKIRAAQAQKRGGGNVRGESFFVKADENGVAGFDAFFDSDPTPETRSEMDEGFQALPDVLPSYDFRRIALMRIEGFSNEEIGGDMQYRTKGATDQETPDSELVDSVQ